jgi:hypothetical protein
VRQNAVYNYGTFAFDGMQGVEDFMAGRFRYWLSVSSLSSTLRAYGAAGRSLELQQLRLTEAERAALAKKLERNARPDQRYYDYDYYRDNCSTRVRDVIDQLIGGQLARQVQGPGSLTFRQHTLRLLGDAPYVYAGLDLALGAPTDQPTTRWQELFLPQELHDALSHATRELDGKTVPLVASERRLLGSEFPPAPRSPPERIFRFGVLGGGFGLLFAVLGLNAARVKSLRIAFGLWSALWGALLGILGSALTWFWFFSKHEAAFRNRALLVCPPWALALTVAGAALVLGRSWAALRLRQVLTLCALGSAVLLLLSLSSVVPESGRLAAFFVPFWSGWLFGARAASSGDGGAWRHGAG